MSISKPVLSLLSLLLFAFAALGCSKPEPVQPVSFNNRLNMSISDKWVLQRDGGKKAYYRYGESDQVKLSFEDQTRDYGTPMTVQGVRSAIGSELNLRNGGGVQARLGLGGTAVLSYEQQVKEGRKKTFTRNWVVAHPFGYGAVARVAITLKVPDGEQGTPEFLALADSIDKQVGDAKMPDA